MKSKTSPDLAEAIFLCKKQNLLDLARAISVPSRKQTRVNIEDLNKYEDKILIIPGKVLSLGEVEKKHAIYALGFSEKAEEKLKKAGCLYMKIIEALRKKVELKGKVIR